MFDVAIVDLRLPDGSGVELAQALSDISSLRLPLLLVSATRYLPPKAEWRAVGIAAVLEKPIPAQMLRRYFAQLVGVQSRVQEPEHNQTTVEGFDCFRVLVAQDNAVTAEAPEC